MKVRNDHVTVFVVRRRAAGDAHEFLQLKRHQDDYLGGTWQTVRGTVEPNESHTAAALRELWEEAGVKPLEFYRLGVVESYFLPFGEEETLWHSVPYCALVSPESVIKLNEEHDDWRWLARGQIDAHTMWASERSLLNGLFRDILDDGPAKPWLRLNLP